MGPTRRFLRARRACGGRQSIFAAPKYSRRTFAEKPDSIRVFQLRAEVRDFRRALLRSSSPPRRGDAKPSAPASSRLRYAQIAAQTR
jgi:hypothetical protein